MTQEIKTFGFDPKTIGRRYRGHYIVKDPSQEADGVLPGFLCVTARDGASNPIDADAFKHLNFFTTVEQDGDRTYRDYYYKPLAMTQEARATAAEARVWELENVVQRLTQPGVWLYLDGRDEDGTPRVMPGGFDVGGVDLEDELEMAKPDLALQIEREAKELGFQDGEYFWTTWTFDNGQYGEFGMCEIQPSWEYSGIDLATSRALAFLGRAET
jgi:hypothetical protein